MTTLTGTAAGLLLAALAVGPLVAQNLPARIAAAPDGEVRLTFASREGICGDGATFIRDLNRDNHVTMSGDWRDWRSRPCEEGPVRIRLRVQGGEVRSVRTAVGGIWRPSEERVTDLGRIGAAEAARGLLSMARNSYGKGNDLIFPATLADSVTLWPDLLELARDRQVASSSRKNAVFWLSQAAGDKAADGLERIVTDEGDDRDVREHAVFAISQLPQDQGVPILLRVARTNPNPGVRRKAMFWLGQSDDPRALSLFEDILTKP
ncbi:MAG: HEAT repeat domain-containing protein [Gemmatimonadales bacterium]|nr:HEAT repeat domain-containing protein [Gemmatimonadales bacterium]